MAEGGLQLGWGMKHIGMLIVHQKRVWKESEGMSGNKSVEFDEN